MYNINPVNLRLNLVVSDIRHTEGVISRKRTFGYVRPAKMLINLCIRAIRSEISLRRPSLIVTRINIFTPRISMKRHIPPITFA